MAISPNQQILVYPNTSPTLITFKRTISLSTTDQNNNNQPVTETYTVTGPSSPGITPIALPGGTKFVIPLSTSSAVGSPFLKIHLPSGSNGNKVYVTYAVSNPYMLDGYYDYKTGVPTEYYNALRAWINTNPSTGNQYTSAVPVVRTRSLKFVAVGNSTNKPGNATTFYVKFQGLFGGFTLSSAPSTNLIQETL